MQVKLRFPWFAPTSPLGTAGGRMSGHYYTAGVYEIDVKLKDHLPKGAEILYNKEEEDSFCVPPPSVAKKVTPSKTKKGK